MAENDNVVAVLGTGIMGAAMARNLISAGMEVRAWNRTRQKAEPLVDDGAKVADSPAEAAEGAGFVLTMLADADAVADAVGGEEGALSVLPDDSIWLQMSTVGLEGQERLAGLADEHGVAYVDAPVLGSLANRSSMPSAVRSTGSEGPAPAAASSSSPITGSSVSSVCWRRLSPWPRLWTSTPRAFSRSSRADLWACPTHR